MNTAMNSPQRHRDRGEIRTAHPRLLISALLCVLCVTAVNLLCSSQARAVEVGALRAVPVLDNGRIKPIDTLARQTARTVTGSEQFQGHDPLALVIDWAANPNAWEKQKVLYVPLIELRQHLGLPEGEQHITPHDLRTNLDFKKWTTDLETRKSDADASGEDPGFTRLETAGLELSQRLRLFDAATAARIYCVVPAAGSSAWMPLNEILSMSDQPLATPVQADWKAVLAAYRAGDQGAFTAAATQLRGDLKIAGGTDYGREAPQSRVDREVAYNQIKPFRLAWITYLAAVAVMVGALLVRNKWVYRAGFALFLLGVTLHVGAFALRCSITGFAPVTNMYETVIWVGGMGAVFALVLESIYRSRVIAIGGAVVATLCTVVADVMPPEYGNAFRNLAPVLRSNYWLTVHVLTIVSSYAAFALAMVLGNIVLGQYLVRAKASVISQNLNFTYRAVQIGVLLVAAGTILGGLWADESWGRFWGWDPKEVWALIVLLVYLALLHGRFAGWIGPFGLAAGAVVCWSAVIMSWYGVNFVLGAGLHSYGFGTGGQGYVGAYVAAQLLYVAVVWMIVGRRHKLAPGSEALRGASPTTAAATLAPPPGAADPL